MRKWLQKRFLGFFVLFIVFVVGMACLLMTLDQHQAHGLLAPPVKGVSIYNDQDSDHTAAPPPEAPVVSAPVAKIVAPAPAKPQPTKASAWVLQVGSYASRGNADRLRHALANGGWSAYVKSDVVQGKPLYRLFVGPFPSLETTKSARDKINQQFHVNAIVKGGAP